jgi:hypothetical protein
VAVLVVVLLVAILSGERNRRPEFGRPRNLLRNLLMMAVLALFVVSLLALRSSDRQREDGRDASTPPTTVAPATADDDAGPPWPVIALGVIVVAALGWAAWSARRHRPLVDADDDALAELRAAAGTTFDASLADLEAEPDPRRAIIAAYARLLDGLAALGLGRRPAEAPDEHLRRALFAEARFSEHTLTAEHKAAAIAAFGAARDELVPRLVDA